MGWKNRRGRKGGSGGHYQHDNRGYDRQDEGSSSFNRGDRGRDFRGGRGPRRGGVHKHHRERSQTINLPMLSRNDIDMDGLPGSSRGGRGGGYQNRGNGRGSNHARGERNRGRMRSFTHQPGAGRTGDPAFFHWLRCEIQGGKSSGKEAVLNTLFGLCQTQFIPYHYGEKEEDAIYFFVNDLVAIEAIKKLKGKIPLPDGKQLTMKIDCSGPPIVTVTPDIKEQMVSVMSNRYNLANRALDLKAFHEEPVFKNAGLYISMSRNTVFSVAMEIIKEFVPGTEAIDLSNNEMGGFSRLSDLKATLPNLKTLYYRENNVVHIRPLKCLDGYKLKELNLEGNPISKSNAEQGEFSKYCREILGIFPELEIIDGKPVVGNVGYGGIELDSGTGVPRPLPGVAVSAEGAMVAMNFLTPYYTYFDSNREPLLQAYHDQAVFSMTTLNSRRKGGSTIPFLEKSRNLNRFDDKNTRVNRMAKGKFAVMEMFTKFPKSKHDYSSFKIDLALCTPTLLQLEVSGFVKVEDGDGGMVMQFSRSFTLVPHPSADGVLITNDVLSITPAPDYWEKHYHDTTIDQMPTPIVCGTPQVALPQVVAQVQVQPPAQPVAVPLALPVVAPVAAPVPPAVVFSPEQKEAFAKRFSVESGLKFDWAVKCLEENEWDYNLAASAFNQLKIQGSIPAEAFP